MKLIFIEALGLGMACIIIVLGSQSPIVAKTKSSMAGTPTTQNKCEPTPADYLGPFYEPDAPVHSRVGNGYRLEGAVMSTTGCAPIANARIEFWLTNSDGSYDDDHRATIFSDDTGAYSFESNFPTGYFGRPPHIHIRISAEGFKTLVTQHYPGSADLAGRFDMVLVPMD